MEERFKRIQCKDREDWLEHRKDGIGGSSCAAIIGRNPFKTNVDYYLEKIGYTHTPVQETNPHIIYGTNAEEPIREMFKLDYGGVMEVYHNDYELLVRNDKPFIRSSLDGELLVIDDCEICGKHLTQGMRGILEIKTNEPSSSASLVNWEGDHIPMNYHCQRLHYLMTTGYDFHILRCDFRRYIERYYDNKDDEWKGGFTKHWTKDYCILANEKIVQDDMKYLEEEETTFWEDHIVPKVEPPLKFNL